jgi:ubiquitin-protein ligase
MGKRFHLPPEGPIASGKKRGNYRYYQPINKRTGQILRGAGSNPKTGLDKTFGEFDIQDGDIIKITEMIVGGADRERLVEDYKSLRKIEGRAQQYVTLQPEGSPPDFYVVRVEGIPGIMKIDKGEPVVGFIHTLTIDLKGSYPENKPEIRFLTPIFHPYVYPNRKVCVTDGWSSTFPLEELFVEIIDRIQCKSPVFPKSVATPANSDAFNWYMANQEKIQEVIVPIPFPPDGTGYHPPLQRKRSGQPDIEWSISKDSEYSVISVKGGDGIQW